MKKIAIVDFRLIVLIFGLTVSLIGISFCSNDVAGFGAETTNGTVAMTLLDDSLEIRQ